MKKKKNWGEHRLVKMLVKTSTSSMRVPEFDSQLWLMLQLLGSADAGSQQVMTWEVGSLPPVWESWIEFLAVAQALVLTIVDAWRSEQADGSLCFLPVCLSLPLKYIFQKRKNNTCWQGCGERESPIHCWSECNGNSMVFLRKLQLIPLVGIWVYIQRN